MNISLRATGESRQTGKLDTRQKSAAIAEMDGTNHATTSLVHQIRTHDHCGITGYKKYSECGLIYTSMHDFFLIYLWSVSFNIHSVVWEWASSGSPEAT